MEPNTAVRWAFPPEPASTREARRRVSRVLETHDLEDAAAAAELVVSELATNAVLHAGTPFEVGVTVGDGVVRIEVHDGVARRPARRYFSDEATSGRGLRLVEQLCDAWGVDVHPGGKSVWAEISASGPARLGAVFDPEGEAW